MFNSYVILLFYNICWAISESSTSFVGGKAKVSTGYSLTYVIVLSREFMSRFYYGTLRSIYDLIELDTVSKTRFKRYGRNKRGNPRNESQQYNAWYVIIKMDNSGTDKT